MKSNVLIAIFAAALAIALSSCTKVETPEFANATVAAVKGVEVNGILGATKAFSGSIKGEWDENDWIYVSGNGAESYFKAENVSANSSFSSCGQLSNISDGVAYAMFPKNVRLEDGKAAFSLSGQNGSVNNLERFLLMTSSSIVKNGEVTFAFEPQVSVFAIDVNEILYNEGCLSKIVVSGKGISNCIGIETTAGEVNVAPSEDCTIEICNPIVNGGVVYIAFRSNSSDIVIDLYDSIGSHFFTTVDAAGMVHGEMYDITNAGWDGGLEITFNPSIIDYERI